MSLGANRWWRPSKTSWPNELKLELGLKLKLELELELELELGLDIQQKSRLQADQPNKLKISFERVQSSYKPADTTVEVLDLKNVSISAGSFRKSVSTLGAGGGGALHNMGRRGSQVPKSNPQMIQLVASPAAAERPVSRSGVLDSQLLWCLEALRCHQLAQANLLKVGS